MLIKRSQDVILHSNIKPSEITSKEVYQSRRLPCLIPLPLAGKVGYS